MSTDVVTWLRERTILSGLSEKVLGAIAANLQPLLIPAHQTVVRENAPPHGLYILRDGQLEGDCPSQSKPILPVGYLPGAILHLQELLLGQPAQRTLTTDSDCQFWFMPGEQFQHLLALYPEIAQALTQQLAQEVVDLTSRLTYEQERLTALRPYLVTKATRGIIGKSRYAVRLRQQIKQAAEDRRSALIFGEPGLEKDNIAALIHFSSTDRRQLILKVNCRSLQTTGADLFGRVGGKPGLMEWLGRGTLILNNIQELPPSLVPALAHLLETGTYSPVARAGQTEGESLPVLTSQARILMISEKRQQVDKLAGHLIKVPPLRVRKADIRDQVDYYISLYCRDRGLPKPTVTAEALRRLQGYDFPGNLKELKNLVERAIVQSTRQAGETVGLSSNLPLTEEVFWSADSKKRQFRVNLLNSYRSLRQFLRSPWWPDRINYGFTLGFFALVVGVLFLGPQRRTENFALTMFWAWWWPLVLLSFPLVGRLWCAVCPFMIYGEVTQKLSQWLFPGQLRPWPREVAERWGGWFLFGLFTLIFLWEELWHLEDTAYLSACLLLLITAGAMIFSALFERRFWCRYLCPIGGMNGLFAKLAITELRAEQGTCSAECSTYQCFKGGPQKGEGLETMGCPLYSHPAQLTDNRDCVLCMTCLKACPHRSVEFNLRPPGIELWTTHVPHLYEVALLLLLLGGVFMHRLPELQAALGISLGLDQFGSHLGSSILAMLFPTLFPIAGYAALNLLHRWQLAPKPIAFTKLVYGYLPLVWGASLAHYLRLGLGEAGQLFPITLATFGLIGEGLPIFVAHPAVVAFLQGTVLVLTIALSWGLTQKIAHQSWRTLLPFHLSISALGIIFWIILVGR